MKGLEAKLFECMEGAKKSFVIPVYQRNYDWKTENCKQLFDDLVKAIQSGRYSHVFGSIASSYHPNGHYWTRMAKFHAEWSKRFYDVFVPYLKQWSESFS